MILCEFSEIIKNIFSTEHLGWLVLEKVLFDFCFSIILAYSKEFGISMQQNKIRLLEVREERLAVTFPFTLDSVIMDLSDSNDLLPDLERLAWDSLVQPANNLAKFI